METGLVGLRVRGIALDEPEGEPLVVLEDRRSGRRVELPAGPFEASAIILELEGIVPPRPLTHDLLAEVFLEGGFSLDDVVLSAGKVEGDPAGCGARARLDYRKGLERFTREVRPADGIALALRLGARIVAEPGLFEAYAARPEPDRPTLPKPRILVLDDWRQRAVGA